MKRKWIIFVLAAVVIIGGFLYANRTMTYSSAKNECERILFFNRSGMESAAIDALNGSDYGSMEYRRFSYSRNKYEDYVKFEIGAQGFLGGQYWELIYTEDGMLFGETDQYSQVQTDGNNIYRAERLDEHWWYLWIDYDGTELSEK